MEREDVGGADESRRGSLLGGCTSASGKADWPLTGPRCLCWRSGRIVECEDARRQESGSQAASDGFS